MIEPDKYWVSSEKKINDIINAEDVINFCWTKNQSDDYILLSESFYNAAQIIIQAIIDDYRDNSKCDQWFFPAIYLYRQAIELLCKGLLISVVSGSEITGMLTDYKHNIISIFNEFYKKDKNKPLSNDELNWIILYLSDLEKIDKESNLFRYPIKDGMLKEYSNDFLDIVDMANSIDQCFSIIFKCVNSKHIPLKYSNDIDLTIEPKVLYFASHGFGNCMLYSSPWDFGYYTQIKGYSEVAYFLVDKVDKNHWSFLPLAFLVRHAIELALKNLLWSRTEICVDKKTQNSKKKKPYYL